MSKHTPGPWFFVDHSWCDKSVYAGLHDVDERRIASFHLDEDALEADEAVELANARLIAAAPDLLAVVRAYRGAQRRMLERWSEGDENVKRDLWKALHACEAAADAAIAKAEGA